MTQAPVRAPSTVYAARRARAATAREVPLASPRLVPATVLPAAVSPLTSALVEAAPREATVLAAFETVLYLGLEQHEQVLPVLAHDALELPTGLCLARRSDQLDWSVVAGDRVLVGGGRVCLPRMTVAAVRARRPQRVAPVVGAEPGRALGVLASFDSLAAAEGELSELAAAAVLAGLSSTGGALNGVAALVGRGAGLTPSGDDALCGVLLTLRAFGCGRGHRAVAEAVRAHTGRTTSLSASLLLAAVDGYALPDVVRLVAALAARSALPDGVTTDWQGSSDRPVGARSGGSCQSVVTVALERVHAIGHTSGRDLVAGVHGTLLALAGATTGACGD